MIDKKVIDGHVIPGHVIFTAPAHLEHPYSTEAFEDNLKVTATFFTQNDGKQTKSKKGEEAFNVLFILMMRFLLRIPFAVYVKSNTVVGDSKHTTGVVLAEIVMGNIPVKNGVVHLIHRPLMVVDTTVAKFLEVCKLWLSSYSYSTSGRFLSKRFPIQIYIYE